MLATTTPIDVDRTELSRLCSKFGVRKLAVFGSVARGEATASSDIDLLYELHPGRSMGYIALERFAESLGELFGFSRVDLVRASQLHWFYRDDVLAEAQVIYEE